MTDKFKIGDRVGESFSEDKYGKKVKLRYVDETPSYGTVTDLTTRGKVFVKWDTSWKNEDANKPIDAKDLMLESERQKEDSRLEAEFQALEKEVKAKVQAAADLLKEAGTMAGKQGQNLADMYHAIIPLLTVMDESGWRTSSFNC